MSDQLTLDNQWRRKPPACYDTIVEEMENARDNGYEIDQWSPEKLAGDLKHCSAASEMLDRKDIEKSIRIWRERNAR